MEPKDTAWNVGALVGASDSLELTDRPAPVAMGQPIKITERQRVVFDEVARRLRVKFNLDASILTDGRVVELLAANFLSGDDSNG